MKNNFNKFMDNIYLREGYYSDHSWDTGGETLFGISRIYNQDWTGWKIWDSISIGGIPAKDKSLNLLRDLVENLYKKKYWNSVMADELPNGVDIFCADCSVNPGNSFIKIALQQASGAYPDGIIGPKTIKAVDNSNIILLLGKLHDKRSVYYALQSNPRTRQTAMGGWINRNREVYEQSLDLADK